MNKKRDAHDFEFDTTLYADDGTFLFDSRNDLINGANSIFSVFERFGMKCHVGKAGKHSKTEAMFFPAGHAEFQKADYSEFPTGGGFVHFADEVKHLGSVVHSSLLDDANVDTRIRAAGAAFGSMRKSIFGTKNVPLRSKRLAFESVVLGVLLHGSEPWTVSRRLFLRLQAFYNTCVRSMCRINRWHSRTHRISQAELEARIGLRPFDEVLRVQQLRWAGHVIRMGKDRLPRKFITSWVELPRRRGRPHLSYGHGLMQQLRKANIPYATWHNTAQGRSAWRKLIDC